MFTFVVSCPTVSLVSASTSSLAHIQSEKRVTRSSLCTFRGRPVLRHRPAPRRNNEHRSSTTPKAIFSGGGILGVGPSEVFVIVAVGWLVLGPEKLFALAKDSGRVLGQLRRTADEAKDTFSEAMDMDMMAREEERMRLEMKSSPKLSNEGNDEHSAELESEIESEMKTTTSEFGGPDDRVVSVGAEDTAPLASGEAIASRGEFLEQLKRVADPNQVAPAGIPDLSADTDEELELRKLESEYLKAKERVESRKRASSSGEAGEANISPER